MSISLGKELGLGCGDNSCIFGATGGMGTNGGCRCCKDDFPFEDGRELRKGVYFLREVGELPHVLAALRFIVKKERDR